MCREVVVVPFDQIRIDFGHGPEAGQLAGPGRTLAMVQYRNSDWRDSLASLEKVKAKQGEFDAPDWLLVAMNRQQRNRGRRPAWVCARLSSGLRS